MDKIILTTALTGATTSLTPATCAGTTVINTVDGYAAAPPGTHTPTRLSGRYRCLSVTPGFGSIVMSLCRMAV